MTYRGRVKNGVIVLDPPASLPEGEEVEVFTSADEKGTASSSAQDGDTAKTWFDVFKDVIGKAEGLPEDSSVNHDHYLYGTPKK